MEDGDERIFQEFAELQDKVLFQTDMINRTNQQERMIVMQRQRSVLTKAELDGMPDTTGMFKSIGRAYFRSPKAEVVKELDARVAQLEADAKKVHDQRDAIDQKMKDTETQLRELLKQSPTLARRLGAVKIQ